MRKLKTRSGDTLIEVMFAVTTFSLVAVISIAAMNLGLAIGEASLESTMARNEIDAQAEAIRYIHNAYLTGRAYKETNQYKKLWEKLIGKVKDTDNINLSVNNCNEHYNGDNGNATDTAFFVVDTRNLSSTTQDDNDTIYSADIIKNISETSFTSASIQPRLVYGDDSSVLSDDSSTTLSAAEGIFVYAVKENNNNDKPEFYDFHIYTCWNAPGKSVPTTIGTIIRLYNPDMVEN